MSMPSFWLAHDAGNLMEFAFANDSAPWCPTGSNPAAAFLFEQGLGQHLASRVSDSCAGPAPAGWVEMHR